MIMGETQPRANLQHIYQVIWCHIKQRKFLAWRQKVETLHYVIKHPARELPNTL